MALSSIGGKFKGVISKDQDLLDAAKNGNVETIRKITTKKRQSTTSQFLPSFLKGSVNINCADREGYTPLHLATLNGHTPAVECLLSLDASVSIKDNSGCTPLHLAAWKGYDEICKLFLTSTNASIPIDLQNSLGDTALHMAAQYGYRSVVSVLLECNADSTIRNLKDESALDLAAQYGKLEVVQLLVTKNPDLVKHTVLSHSPLHLSAACGHVEIISTLLEAGFDINTKTNTGTALHTAAMYCKMEVVRILVESGIDIHALDSEGKTALEIILRNDQTQHKYASIAKFIRDHIMMSDTKEDDSNVYDTSFDVNTAIPPPAPIVYDTLDSRKMDASKDTEIITRPTPKPRLSLGETEEERKSALYAKANKDRSKINEESPKSEDSISPKVPPRASAAFSLELTISQEAIAEERHFHPPDLPKKERDSIPPLPPKTDDIPLLPPKVTSPTADMVVADLPPTRVKSQELLDAPPPCDGGTVEPAHSGFHQNTDSSNYENIQFLPGGYFAMTDKKSGEIEAISPSPISKKKRPEKPPRKKSPAPARKHELTPVKQDDLDASKEDYETMGNVKKSESDTSFSEDVYKTLFSNLKEEKSDTKNSSDAIPAEIVPCDPEYTNISATADFMSKEKHRTDPVSVPFSKYSKEKLDTSQTQDSNLTEIADDIYHNVCISKDEHSSLSTRTSTGFQQSEPESGGHSSSVAESDSDKRVSKTFDSKGSSDRVSETFDYKGSSNRVSGTFDCKESSDKEDKSIPVTEKTCHSNGCDSDSDKIIPENKSISEINIPNDTSKSSDIPEDSKTDNLIKDSIPSDNLQDETCIPCESIQNQNDLSSQDEKTLSEVPKRTSIEADSFIPELPPKPGGDNQSLANVLASEEKRISNGSSYVHDDPDQEEDLKTPKPPSLEFTKKRKAEHKFPMTPTGYPQPPTPDFPPPSPNTALKGIEQKIAVIEVTSNKRSSRDIETETEDMNVKTEGDTSSSDKNTDQSEDIKTDETTKSEIESRSHDEEEQEEPVVLRRSRISSSGSGHEVLLGDELQPFAGLLRGSIAGGPRKVISQIYENVALSHKKAGAKRSSLPLGNMTFEPVMEREEDVSQSERIPSYEKRPVKISGMKEDGSFDDKDEWEQIADIVSSFGGKLSHDESMSAYDADISNLAEDEGSLQNFNMRFLGTTGRDVIADIMASFGAGIDRESVFVEKFEALFTKHLAGAGSNLPIHSVGEWLESLGLGQYENTLYANGFDDTDFLGEKIMEEQDLDSIGIIISDHRKKILDHAKLLPQINPISADKLPQSVESWLNSLRIPQYLDKFISHKFDTMERVLQLWELELSTVLDISSLGHRKRMLASLGERSPQERHFTSLKKKSRLEPNKNKSPFTDINLYKDYTKVKPLTSTSEDDKSSKPETPTVDNNDNDDVFQNNVQGKSIKDESIHIRPPHQANTTASIKQWRHRPEMLIKGCCNYTAQYLGSTLVKNLTGTSSTIEGIAKLKKSADVIAKIPTIMLSISYRGVKFIDAKSKKVICDHEIVNIFCACQDAESMNFFAYITRDNETGKHYCHVFSVRTADLAREVIMTLGEAFEVAYQMAQKEKAAVEAQEFERTLSQSDAEDSSQSKSSSKASLNTV